MKHKPSIHVCIVRIIAGLIAIGYGIHHVLYMREFHDYLRVSEIPFHNVITVLFPVFEFGVGFILLIGWKTRVFGIIATIVSAIYTLSSYVLTKMDPNKLPAVCPEKPPHLPLYANLIILIIFLYIAIRGAGAFSLDAHAKKKHAKEKAEEWSPKEDERDKFL